MLQLAHVACKRGPLLQQELPGEEGQVKGVYPLTIERSLRSQHTEGPQNLQVLESPA